MSLDYSLRCHGCGDLLFDKNITHNLNKMAEQVGINEKDNLYNLLWSPPERNTREYREKIAEGYKRTVIFKNVLLDYEAENNWGTYEGFEEFVHAVLQALYDFPEALIEVSK